ncbi:unnamed protein product [Leuciscus chuanchicus]
MEDSGAGGARCIVGEITRKPELKADLSHFLSEENKGCLPQRERKTRNHLHIRSRAQDQYLMETDLKEAAVAALDSSEIFQVITMSSMTGLCRSHIAATDLPPPA